MLDLAADEVELDPVHQRAIVNRPGMRGAAPQRLAIRLTGPLHVFRADRAERHQLDQVHLN